MRLLLIGNNYGYSRLKKLQNHFLTSEMRNLNLCFLPNLDIKLYLQYNVVISFFLALPKSQKKTLKISYGLVCYFF